jgi:multidrug efflux pump subunit AcrB
MKSSGGRSDKMTSQEDMQAGIIGRIVSKFLDSQLSVILVIAALCVGVASVMVTPREEEPQIVVPLADVFIQVPGASPAEVETLVATRLESLLWQIDGVEYVYSMSYRDMAVVTVRFYVGEDRENSLVKLHNKISMNIDIVPPIVKGWVIKPVEIDDVPIVNLTMYSDKYNDHDLYRMGEEVLFRLSKVENISRTSIVGGRKREIRVELQTERMSAMNVSMLEVFQALKGADASVTAGSYSRFNTSFRVTGNSFLTGVDDVNSLVIGVNDKRPVYLRDVASVEDGPEEPSSYSRITFSDASLKEKKDIDTASHPAVTLALAKKKGTNAVKVAEDILQKLDELKKTVIPDDVYVKVTRNYGETAQEKVSGLLSSLLFAVVSVVILLAFTLGWREAMVVALAVPISFSLALFVNFLFGYTINRVTLFALILSLGLVVDDPITNVDNIQRHIFKGKFDSFKATIFAVDEVLPPVIMSTIAIIICFVPLFFITGMMGPYMAPMAANVPLTVIFSTVCALTIVPWMAHLLLKNVDISKESTRAADNGGIRKPEGKVAEYYEKIILPFLDSRINRYLLLLLVVVLLIISMLLAVFKLVPLKLLPFDNKSELQLVVDMPEGTTLENTDSVVRDFEEYFRGLEDVTNTVSYVGISSPIDFNGLVRHYYLREGKNLADIRVNLVDKDNRKLQSHGIALKLRNDLEKIAKDHGAIIKIVEVPPGPPVLSTIVGEVYGSPDRSYDELIKGATHVKNIMAQEDFVVDIDDMAEVPHDEIDFFIDKEKAALHGVSAEIIIQSIRMAMSGASPATVHVENSRSPLYVKIILPEKERSGIVSLTALPIKTATGDLVPLAELVKPVVRRSSQPIYHKNLERVVYVTAETAGRAPAEAILGMMAKLKDHPMPEGTRVSWSGEGEWKITIRVFRDMGIAFAAALLGIYILLVIQSGSFFMPVLIMMAIPLTLLGIMPGFFLLNVFFAGKIDGFANPVFFTATSMIGMIALGGIVIRNSLVLIEFIQEAVRNNVPFKEAILQSGAIRLRPIVLTAMTTALGALPITLDPVFSGLAWALIFGLLASTVFTLVIVPVTYYALYRDKAVAG